MSDSPFPALRASGFEVTSPATPAYNCIAWAAGENGRWWWPNPFGYWPDGVPVEETVEAFVLAYRTLGYEPCADGELEAGYEKVAIFSLNGKPTHAARQLPDGKWTSKLGMQVDLSHGLGALNGPQYGEPTSFVRRKLIVVQL